MNDPGMGPGRTENTTDTGAFQGPPPSLPPQDQAPQVPQAPQDQAPQAPTPPEQQTRQLSFPQQHTQQLPLPPQAPFGQMDRQEQQPRQDQPASADESEGGSRRVAPIVAGVAFVAVLAAIAGAVYIFWLRAPHGTSGASDAEQIEQTLRDWNTFVNTNQATTASQCMCGPQAEAYVAQMRTVTGADFDVPVDDDFSDAAFTVRDVEVRGEIARATVDAGNSRSVTMHFRRENGRWKICDSVAAEFR